jgi:hypothetical protein
MKISENEKKVLMIWLIVGILILLVVALVNIRFNSSTNNSTESTTPGENHITDASRYYTVKNAINKYYSYKNAHDYESVIKILSESYVSNNNITTTNITDYIGTSTSYMSYDTGIICLKSVKSGVYVYDVEGVEVVMNTGEEKESIYYEVTLDGNTQLFSITPIDSDTYRSVCNG